MPLPEFAGDRHVRGENARGRSCGGEKAYQSFFHVRGQICLYMGGLQMAPLTVDESNSLVNWLRTVWALKEYLEKAA